MMICTRIDEYDQFIYFLKNLNDIDGLEWINGENPFGETSDFSSIKQMFLFGHIYLLLNHDLRLSWSAVPDRDKIVSNNKFRIDIMQLIAQKGR